MRRGAPGSRGLAAALMARLFVRILGATLACFCTCDARALALPLQCVTARDRRPWARGGRSQAGHRWLSRPPGELSQGCDLAQGQEQTRPTRPVRSRFERRGPVRSSRIWGPGSRSGADLTPEMQYCASKKMAKMEQMCGRENRTPAATGVKKSGVALAFRPPATVSSDCCGSLRCFDCVARNTARRTDMPWPAHAESPSGPGQAASLRSPISAVSQARQYSVARLRRLTVS